jgi:hypothetical protein
LNAIHLVEGQTRFIGWVRSGTCRLVLVDPALEIGEDEPWFRSLTSRVEQPDPCIA